MEKNKSFKPCWMCGEETEIMMVTERKMGQNYFICFLQCWSCGAQGPVDESETEAIMEWNKVEKGGPNEYWSGKR
jgi:predicted RNA-binding Zn-ribbon protein involved in translation (DUF1610 family)